MFGITKRYRAICLAKNEGKYWFEQATEEYDYAQMELGVAFTRDKWIDYQISSAKRKPNAEGNFIKVEFLEALKKKGAFKSKE